MHRDLVLMLLADARLPVAGHTQSGTLEPAVRDGLGADGVPAYARSRLRTVTTVEAAAAVVARHLVLGRGAADLEDLEEAWEARSPSAPLREASRRQGRALLRLARRTWPGAVALDALPPAPPRALVLGAVAASLELDAAGLARLVGYDDVQTVCAASLKLLPLDPTVVTGWVAALLPDVEALTVSVSHLTDVDDLPAPGSPLIEAWAQAHAVTSRRLFHA
ncbi:urease accessory UreF family protein [Nocardioides ginkgobilobae]